MGKDEEKFIGLSDYGVIGFTKSLNLTYKPITL